MPVFSVVIISFLIGSAYSSNCAYWNGDLFMFAIPMDVCMKMQDFVNDQGVYTKNSESVSCITINNQQYLEHKTYENSRNCTKITDDLVSIDYLHCANGECNCIDDSSLNDCKVAIFTNYAENEETGDCDYTQYQQRKVIVDECIPVQNMDHNSYIVSCDENDGLQYTAYSGLNCQGNIIQTDYALHTKDDHCYSVQCPTNELGQIIDPELEQENENDDNDNKDLLAPNQNNNTDKDEDEDEDGRGCLVNYKYCILIAIFAIILQN